MKKLFLISIMFLLAAISINVFAEDAPKPPLNFTATLLDPTDEGYPVEFKWERDTSGVTPDYYVIYYATKLTDDTSAFKKLKVIEYEPKDQFSIKKYIGPGEYSFFMVAVKTTDSMQLLVSERTAIVQLTIEENQNPYIKIISKPKDDGKIAVNTEWTYQVKVNTNILTPVKFKFEGTVPAGMTMNGDTGLVRWTPADTMSFTLTIIAYSAADTALQDTQHLQLTVISKISVPHDTCATIQGIVRYDDSTVVTNGKVIAWFIQKVDTLKDDDDDDDDGDDDDDSEIHYEFEKFSAEIDSNGHYSFKLAEGSYILQVKGDSFYKEFYVNTNEIADAQVFNVKCGDSSIVDFYVTKKIEPHKFTVTGRVTDKTGNIGVYAIVEFIVDQKNNYKDDYDDDDKKIFRVNTDHDGYYSIDLLDIYVYVAHARPKEKGSLYLDQYFDSVSTYSEATKIILVSDTTNVNFYLDNLEDGPKGKLSGQVVDKNNDGIPAVVTAYLVNAHFKKEKNFVYSVSVMTDSVGNFVFDGLYYGDYIIQSIPQNRRLYPGYYVENDFVVKKWKNASQVSIAADDNGTILIKHQPKHGHKGVIKFHGKIKKNIHALLKNLNAYIGGSIIYIYKDNQVIDFAISDENGDFEFDELPEGTYYFVVDKIGYESGDGTVEFNYKNKRDINITIILIPIIVLNADQSLMTDQIKVYPNPANDRIFFDVPNVTTVQVTNYLGDDFPVTYTTNDTGTNVDINKLPAGIYVIRVQSDNKIISKLFVIQR